MKIRLLNTYGFPFLKDATFPLEVTAEEGTFVSGTVQVHRNEFIKLGFEPNAEYNKPYFNLAKDEVEIVEDSDNESKAKKLLREQEKLNNSISKQVHYRTEKGSAI